MHSSMPFQALLTALFFLGIFPLLAFASPVAAPAPAAAANAIAVPAPVADAEGNALERRQISPRYYLRVEVQHPANVGRHSRFNGRYVQIYHTGAGTNDVQLVTNRSATPPGFINGTYQQFALGGLTGQSIPWGLYMPTLVEYTQWQAPTIDVGYGYDYGAFFLDANDRNALVWNTAAEPGNPRAGVNSDSNGFDGWLACDWWHGVPQLFWKLKGFDRGFKLTSNCEEIKLKAEFVR